MLPKENRHAPMLPLRRHATGATPFGPDVCQHWAELVADGEMGFPEGLSHADKERLADEVCNAVVPGWCGSSPTL